MDLTFLQRHGLYLLVFAAVFLLIFLTVGMIQGISMEHYDHKVKDKTAGGHCNDIGYFVAPRVLLQIQISIGTLLMALIVAILLFCRVFMIYVLIPVSLLALGLGFALPIMY